MQKRVFRAGFHPRYVQVIFICRTRGKGIAPGSAGTRVGGQGLCLAFPLPGWLQLCSARRGLSSLVASITRGLLVLRHLSYLPGSPYSRL